MDFLSWSRIYKSKLWLDLPEAFLPPLSPLTPTWLRDSLPLNGVREEFFKKTWGKMLIIIFKCYLATCTFHIFYNTQTKSCRERSCKNCFIVKAIFFEYPLSLLTLSDGKAATDLLNTFCLVLTIESAFASITSFNLYGDIIITNLKQENWDRKRLSNLLKAITASDWGSTQGSRPAAPEEPCSPLLPTCLAARSKAEKILIGPLEVQKQQPVFRYKSVVNIYFLKSPW